MAVSTDYSHDSRVRTQSVMATESDNTMSSRNPASQEEGQQAYIKLPL